MRLQVEYKSKDPAMILTVILKFPIIVKGIDKPNLQVLLHRQVPSSRNTGAIPIILSLSI